MLPRETLESARGRTEGSCMGQGARGGISSGVLKRTPVVGPGGGTLGPGRITRLHPWAQGCLKRQGLGRGQMEQGDRLEVYGETL